MASQHCGDEEEKWEVASVYRFHRLEQSLSKRSLSYALNRPVGRCNSRPSSDEFLRCLLMIPLDTIGLGRSGEDDFCHSHWKLPLQSDVLWFGKCKVYLSEDNDHDVQVTIGQEY